ncbi:MAG: DnaB helicase C-terminal domain-containing protein, partial [Actinobacteria bacterium]|nr:DnaB helicase C-terminal domain-containing protein [Actinomycetota bacterium]
TAFRAVVRNLAEKPEAARDALDLLKDALTRAKDPGLWAVVQGHLKDVELKRVLMGAVSDFTGGEFDPGALARTLSGLDRAQAGESAVVTQLEKELRLQAGKPRFPTGWKSMDAALGGGWTAGEIVVWIAPPFRGKTWALTSLTDNSLHRKVPCSWHSNDLDRPTLLTRVAQAICRQSQEWVLAHPRAAAQRLKKLAPLEVWDHARRKATIADVRRATEQFAQEVGRAPLVFVDPMDKIRHHSGGKDRHTLRSLVEDLREIAQSVGCTVHCSTWSGRQTYDPDRDASMVDVSESIGKVEEADGVVILNQSATERVSGVIRATLEKARERELHGKQDVLLVADMRCQRMIDDPAAVEKLYGSQGGS